MKIPFFQKNKEVDKKVYRHLCIPCRKEFNYNEKKGYCSDCGNKFDNVVEYISIRSLGRFNIYDCDTCKIRFETKEKDTSCIKCGKSTVYSGYIWKCGGGSFWDRFIP
jgi:Zn finger protein HypA/HybF involved in hydrogenase expression